MIEKRKVVLFSPNGYIGGSIKEKIQKETNVMIYEVTRNSDLEQYKEDYDIMLYSASVTSVRHETAAKYIQDNVVMAVHMMQFCKQHHVKRIIYLSSDEIYGDLNTDIVTEETYMVNPNIYATTKYLAEKIIIDSGISYYILRMPGVVGKIWGKTFIYRLMDRIRNNERIELYNLNKKFNNILEIDDLTNFIIKLCKINDYTSQIFLLGNTEIVTLEEIVSYMISLYHSDSVVYSKEAAQKRYFILDVAKAVQYGYSSKKITTIINELYHLQKG